LHPRSEQVLLRMEKRARMSGKKRFFTTASGNLPIFFASPLKSRCEVVDSDSVRHRSASPYFRTISPGTDSAFVAADAAEPPSARRPVEPAAAYAVHRRLDRRRRRLRIEP
jgi:hypothetical protein